MENVHGFTKLSKSRAKVYSDDEIQIFECEICSYVSTTIDGMESHLYKKHSIAEKLEENYEKITMEQYRYERRQKFIKMGTHCKICDKHTSTPWNFVRHIQSVHGFFDSAFAPFSCPICPGKFVHKKSMENHLLVRHEMIPPETEEISTPGNDASSVSNSKKCVKVRVTISTYLSV